MNDRPDGIAVGQAKRAIDKRQPDAAPASVLARTRMIGRFRRRAAMLKLEAFLGVTAIAAVLGGGAYLLREAGRFTLDEIQIVRGPAFDRRARLEADESAIRAGKETIVQTRQAIVARSVLESVLDQKRIGVLDADTVISSMWFTDAAHGWAAGSQGTILTTTDAGTTWTKRSSGTREDLFCVRFADDLNGWAVGEKGTIVASNDGGATWQPRDSGTAAPLTSLTFSGRDHVWAAGGAGTILASADGGATWRKAETGVAHALSSIHFASSCSSRFNSNRRKRSGASLLAWMAASAHS